MLSITEIHRQYPDPWVSHDPRRAHAKKLCYCVGGAILLAEGYAMIRFVSNVFPFPPTLAASLQRLRPGLTKEDASAYATAITRANDAGEFEGAWALAEQALAGSQD